VYVNVVDEVIGFLSPTLTRIPSTTYTVIYMPGFCVCIRTHTLGLVIKIEKIKDIEISKS
jgi:hypothetical protein